MDQTKYTCSEMWPTGHQFTICPAIFPSCTTRIYLFVAFWLDLLGRKANKNIFSKHLISYIFIWFDILLIHLLPQKVLGKFFTRNFFFLPKHKKTVCVCVPVCVCMHCAECVGVSKELYYLLLSDCLWWQGLQGISDGLYSTVEYMCSWLIILLGFIFKT